MTPPHKVTLSACEESQHRIKRLSEFLAVIAVGLPYATRKIDRLHDHEGTLHVDGNLTRTEMVAINEIWSQGFDFAAEAHPYDGCGREPIEVNRHV